MNTYTKEISARLSVHNLLGRQAIQITTYVEYLLKVNKRVSLTKVGDFDSWFTNHVEDSLLAFKSFDACSFTGFVDCGSGNGLPGILFGILSDLPFTLCDVDLRKCEFLKSVIYKLALKGEVFDRPVLEFSPPSENPDFCYVYRGLGPDRVLLENFEARPRNAHFRLVSELQTSLFPNSERKKYFLSDKSFREIELSL